MKQLIYFLLFTSISSTIYSDAEKKIPLVMLHGIASSKSNLFALEEFIKEHFNLEIFNIEIGDGFKDSYSLPMNVQLDILCNTVYENERLKNGFNFLGMSQGGLLARGYVQYCNLYPVKNLITLVTPHGGVYDPNILIVKLLNVYSPETQKDLSFTNYWRNPFQYDLYLTNCTYLPKLNEETSYETIDEISNNLDVLDNFVMVWSPFDEILFPPESGKFSTYKPQTENKELIVENLENNIIFKENKLGLKKMYEENRLIMFATDCTHSEHRDPKCFHQLLPIFRLYL